VAENSKDGRCPACGEPYGSNKDCRSCIKRTVEAGSAGVTPDDLGDILRRADDFGSKGGKKAPAALFARFLLLVRVVRDYWSGTYREMPWGTVAAIAFAVVYTLSPIDLVPDFIPIVGWLDDAAVVSAVWAGIEVDLRTYCVRQGLDPAAHGL
jgi:uncharacterized membrane protein YkvA (DUF1232 family)